MRDVIDLLKREALLRRNAAILKAKRDYYHELKIIRQIGRNAGLCVVGRPRKVVADTPVLRATPTALKILMEGKVMTIMELALEAQRRGCRSADDPQAVAHAIRGGLEHYRARFRVEAGRWSVI